MSMSVIASVLLYSALAPGQETKTYRDSNLGLTFQYPATWTLKKEKYSTDLSFAAADGSTSFIRIFRTQFRQDKATWQLLQREINDQMKRRVTRQWEEQILGVPLLLTQIEYEEGDVLQSTIVGLLYTATQEKLNFRLSSTAGTIADADAAWRQALVSLRTLSGEMPIPEDPTKPLPNPNKTESGRPITRLTADGQNGAPVRTKNVQRVSALGQQLDVYLPEGWSTKEEEGDIFLTTEKLAGTVRLMFYPGGRQQVATILRTANGSSFDRFGLVKLRDDPVPAVMKSGAYVASTLRVGSGAAGGEAVAWHIVGTSGSVVWRIDYASTTEAEYKADRKQIERLADYTAVEIVR